MTAHPETDHDRPEGAALTDVEILDCLRTLAAELDPARRGIYHTMERARVVAAADVAMHLLIEHFTYLAYPRVGRRRHNAEVHAILDQTNPAQLMIALAWALLAPRLLPRKPHASDRP